ncbi:MAG: hypothetical protein J0M19_12790 [Sphingomonadales bacterium]|nr:hypothetical protein [Sphingomonadales bacterium]
MATLILGAIGTLVGGPIGGSIGALIGRSVDGRIFGNGRREGPRLNELSLTTSSYGAPIPRHFGRMRVAGQIIWATQLAEHRDKQGGGKGSPTVTSYSYTASFAVALSSRPIAAVGRVWADGKLLRGEAGDLKTGGIFRFHSGQADQSVDPLIAATEAGGRCPAYRGLAYAVFEDLQLGDFGNRLPSLSFEIFADEPSLTVGDLLDGVVDNFAAEMPLPGVRGLSIEGPLVETLASLDPFYPINCDACDDELVLTASHNVVLPVTLGEPATSSAQDDFGSQVGFVRKRAGQDSAPIAVLRYYDLDRDYQPGAQRAPGRPSPGQPRAVDLPATLDAAAARQAIHRASNRASWNRQTMSWRVAELDPQVRPGATVSLPGHAGLWCVAEWEWRESGIELTLTRLPPVAVPTTPAADSGRIVPPPDEDLAATVLMTCELPWDGISAKSVPLIMAMPSAATSSWSGASLYVDRGDAVLQPLGPTGRTRAIIGTALSQLAPASPLLFDRTGSVEIMLAGADLSLVDATMRQLAMGANRALVGQEIIQFATAQPMGEGRWKLSGLWRGRGGTEDAIATHMIGEAFILLDGTGIKLDTEAIGNVPDTAIVAIGLADTDPVRAPILLRGIALRPLGPVHAQWTVLTDGSHQLRWVRRARGAWLWSDSVDVPLTEQVEVYEVSFVAGGQVAAQWETTTTALTITANEIAGLRTTFPTGHFAIRQRGDHALSRPLHIDLPAP